MIVKNLVSATYRFVPHHDCTDVYHIKCSQKHMMLYGNEHLQTCYKVI